MLDPAPGRILVRTTASPFCATDVMNAAGEFGKQPPLILGHASTGVVESLGPGVTRVAVGDRVVVHGTAECSRCFYCVRGRTDQCSEVFDRADGWPVVARRADGTPVPASGNVGGYAELMSVSELQVVVVDTALPDAELALMGCGITTGLGSVFNVARVRPGADVAVVGCGHLGVWMIQAARLAGAERIIAVEPDDARRALAGEVGATDLVDPRQSDPVDRVRGLTDGRGVEYALEAAGPALAQRQAVLMTHRGGVAVFTGAGPLGTEISLPQAPTALQGRTIIGSQNGNVRMHADIPRYVRMLEERRIDPTPLLGNLHSLSGVNDALHASRERSELTPLIIPGPSQPRRGSTS